MKKLFAKKNTACIDKDKLPRHIAIIMDGNGRWAKKRNMPREYGHKRGAQVFREVCDHCNKLGIKYMTKSFVNRYLFFFRFQCHNYLSILNRVIKAEVLFLPL